MRLNFANKWLNWWQPVVKSVSCGRTSTVFIDARNDATAQESAHLLPELDALVA